MKRKFLLLTLIALLLLPVTTLAAENTYESKNLIETLEEEEIDLEYEDYEENNKQVTIYLFRGTGCAYCRSFLEFLNEISEEYGKYFKLKSYEVWTNTNNQELLENVSSFLGQSANGVPYIIIGEQVFAGYSEQYADSIKAAIKAEYSKTSKYDAIEEYEKAKAKEERESFYASGKFTVSCNFVIITIATLIVILFINYKMNVLISKVDELAPISSKEHKRKK